MTHDTYDILCLDRWSVYIVQIYLPLFIGHSNDKQVREYSDTPNVITIVTNISILAVEKQTEIGASSFDSVNWLNSDVFCEVIGFCELNVICVNIFTKI